MIGVEETGTGGMEEQVEVDGAGGEESGRIY